jgi:hypothetical protein
VTARGSWLPFVALLALGCEGEEVTAGLDEPIRVRDRLLDQPAQFQPGVLPGLPPLTAAEINAGVQPITPTITAGDASGRLIRPGQTEKNISGRASTDTLAVGIALEGLGAGYWVFPVGPADNAFDGEFFWNSLISFGYDIPPGSYRLLVAAIGADGASGHQGAPLRPCVLPPIPDNENACDPTIAPPSVVVSLDWDRNVDLDVQVRAPNGKLLTPKAPSTAIGVDGGKPDPKAPGVGILEKDSNSSCELDGPRRENVVWQTKPFPGTYAVYANLFDACSERSVRFNVTIYQSSPGDEPGTFRLVESFRQSGTLLAPEANGGSKVGLFVTEFNVN